MLEKKYVYSLTDDKIIESPAVKCQEVIGKKF